jgi:hypothetical protein
MPHFVIFQKFRENGPFGLETVRDLAVFRPPGGQKSLFLKNLENGQKSSKMATDIKEAQ